MKEVFDRFLFEDKPYKYKLIAYDIDRIFFGFLSDGNTKACASILKDIIFFLDKSKRAHNTGKVSVLYDLYQKCSFHLRQFNKKKK
jgi:hypothetical protein